MSELKKNLGGRAKGQIYDKPKYYLIEYFNDGSRKHLQTFPSYQKIGEHLDMSWQRVRYLHKKSTGAYHNTKAFNNFKIENIDKSIITI